MRVDMFIRLISLRTYTCMEGVSSKGGQSKWSQQNSKEGETVAALSAAYNCKQIMFCIELIDNFYKSAINCDKLNCSKTPDISFVNIFSRLSMSIEPPVLLYTVSREIFATVNMFSSPKRVIWNMEREEKPFCSIPSNECHPRKRISLSRQIEDRRRDFGGYLLGCHAHPRTACLNYSAAGGATQQCNVMPDAAARSMRAEPPGIEGASFPFAKSAFALPAEI